MAQKRKSSTSKPKGKSSALSSRTKKQIDSLPEHAQEIYKEAHANALKQYQNPAKRRGGKKQSAEQVAHKTAWAAVKNHETLGLDITVDWSSMGASFLSAGGYHRHIGMNTWNSLNGNAHILGMAGLEYFTITTPDTSTINTIKSIMDDSVTSERQEKQLQDENNENQI